MDIYNGKSVGNIFKNIYIEGLFKSYPTIIQKLSTNYQIMIQQRSNDDSKMRKQPTIIQ